MKIKELISQNSEVSANFDNGAWAGIDTANQTWEYQSDADDEETYCSGAYLVDAAYTVYEYDGIFELPPEVVMLLMKHGYAIDL